jgi:hypothetical protein
LSGSGSFYFDGSDQLKVAQNPILTSPNMAISLFIKRDSGATTVQYLLDNLDNGYSTYDGGYALSVTSTGGAVAYLESLSAPQVSSTMSPSLLTAGVWTHYVVQFKTTSTNTVEITHYFNGIKKNVDTKTLTGGIKVPPRELMFSNRNSGSGLGLKGYLDNVKIFPRVLTDQEILQLCNEGSPTVTCG